MTDCSTDTLLNLLRESDWVKGAVNYDEDLHFSTFYLRASCASQTRPLYPGYTAIVASYTGFNETYYLLKKECRTAARALVRKALRRPDWLGRVVAAIYRRSDRLAGLFDARTSTGWLRRLPDARLLGLYRRHAACQRALYRVARLPEALDRGVSYFTNYLLRYLRGRGVTAENLGAVFEALSQPLVPSVLTQEIMEFDQIVRDVRARPHAEDLAAHNGRARMVLDPGVLARLDAHRERWQFLSYHGYGRRELATAGQYLARLNEQLRQPHSPAADLPRRFEQSRAERQRVLDQLPLDAAHRRLFEIYPEIGAAKLHRRHAQLRNFYYLDLLLAELARRFGVAEWAVRSMLPEEVEDCLASSRPVPAAVAGRTPDCLYARLGGREVVVGGDAARDLACRFREHTRRGGQGQVLTGVVASQGKVTGRCRVLIRADDAGDDFAPGTIVVSESTDPDLLGFLRRAGGVLTEQGGVTSHAAIVCRELGLPTIVGIEGLLDRVRDGDLLEVDAYRGTVTLLRHGEAPAHDGGPTPAAAPETVGAKAYNLGVVRSLGFHVPAFEVVAFAALQRAAACPNGAADALATQTAACLGLADGEQVAVRSSAVGEDGTGASLAGEFCSLLHVGVERLADAFREFVRANQVGKRGTPYRGGVIVQRMIRGEVGGVCLTRDARTGRGDAVILEMTAGGNAGVTGGTAAPDRLVVDRLTGDILEADRRAAGLGEAALDVGDLVRQFLTLEARFGIPLDVEWALSGGKLYILQARPIVLSGAQAPGGD